MASNQLIAGVSLGDAFESGGQEIYNYSTRIDAPGWLSFEYGQYLAAHDVAGLHVDLNLTVDREAVAGSAVAMALSGAPLVLGLLGDLLAFGAAKIDAPQQLFAAGIESFRLGSHIAAPDTPARSLRLDLTGAYAAPAGVNVSLNWGPYVAVATAGDQAVVGVGASIASADLIHGAGDDFLRIGIGLIADAALEARNLLLDLTAAWEDPGGFVRMDFDSARRPVSASGINALALGGVDVTLGGMRLLMDGFDSSHLSALALVAPDIPARMLLLDLVGEYAPPSATSIQLSFGAGGNRATEPDGLDELIMPTPHVELMRKVVELDGLDELIVGGAAIRLLQQFVNDASVGDTLSMDGRPTIFNLNRVIGGARVANALQTGNHAVLGTKFIQNVRLNHPQQRFGNAEIIALNREVYAISFVFDGVGEPDVSFPPQIYADGIESWESGIAFLAGGVREFPFDGFESFVFGDNRISFLVARMRAAWFVDTRYGAVSLGFDRDVRPLGFDATQHGGAYAYDFRQYAESLTGEILTQWGRRQHARIGFAARPLRPRKFYEGDSHNIGFPKIHNNTQFIAADYVSTQWIDGAFGRYYMMLVRNRNVSVDLDRSGIKPPFQYISPKHSIKNNARIVDLRFLGTQTLEFGRVVNPYYPQGMQVTRGYRNIVPAQFPERPPNRWAHVQNIAELLGSFGIDGSVGQFGSANVATLLRNYKWIGVGKTDGHGTPFVAPRVREIKMRPHVPVRTDSFGKPGLAFEQEIVADQHPVFGWGAVTALLDVRGRPSPRLRPGSMRIDWSWGRPRLHNVTPEITPLWGNMWFDQYGDTQVFLEWRRANVQGWLETQMPQWQTIVVSYADRNFVMRGRDYLIFQRFHEIRNVIPDPPYSQPVGPASAGDQARYGATRAVRRGIDLSGFDSSVFGATDTRAMSIFPDSVLPPYSEVTGMQVGIPTVPGPQTVIASSVEPPPLDGPERTGWPRLSPYTIWAPRGAPAQAVDNHPGREEYIDEFLDRNNPASRPFWGRARIESTIRTVATRSGGEHGRYGNPRITPKPWRADPGGIRSFKPGFPWADGGDREIVTYSAGDMSQVGAGVSIEIIEPFNRELLARDFSMLRVGSLWIANFIRYPGVNGLDAAHHGATWIHPPPPPAEPDGLIATIWGSGSFIAYRVRDVLSDGFDSFVSEYDLHWFRDRLRVSHVNTAISGAVVGDTLRMPVPTVSAAFDQGVVAGGLQSSIVVWQKALGHNHVAPGGAPSRVAFGDAWVNHGVDGQILVRGDDHLLSSMPAIGSAMIVVGRDALIIGGARISPPPRTIEVRGADVSTVPAPVLVGFGCGPMARIVGDIDDGGLGRPTVHETVTQSIAPMGVVGAAEPRAALVAHDVNGLTVLMNLVGSSYTAPDGDDVDLNMGTP